MGGAPGVSQAVNNEEAGVNTASLLNIASRARWEVNP